MNRKFYTGKLIANFYCLFGAMELKITHKIYKNETHFNVNSLTNTVQTIVVYPEDLVDAFLNM